MRVGTGICTESLATKIQGVGATVRMAAVHAPWRQADFFGGTSLYLGILQAAFPAPRLSWSRPGGGWVGKREGCQGDWVKSEDQEVAYSNSRCKGGRNFEGRAVKPPPTGRLLVGR